MLYDLQEIREYTKMQRQYGARVRTSRYAREVRPSSRQSPEAVTEAGILLQYAGSGLRGPLPRGVQVTGSAGGIGFPSVGPYVPGLLGGSPGFGRRAGRPGPGAGTRHRRGGKWAGRRA